MLDKLKSALFLALGGSTIVLIASALTPVPSSAGKPTELCGRYDSAQVADGYVVATNRWNSAGELCISTEGGTDFTVSKSTVGFGNVEAPDRGPGGYPNIATKLDDPQFPIAIPDLGEASTSWSVTAPDSGVYNAAYDLWYHPEAAGCPGVITDARSIEIMIWLKHPGLEIPADWRVADGVDIDGTSYNVFQFTGPTQQAALIYEMVTPVDEVSGLKLAPIAQDATARGKLSATGVLCQVSAGFEIHDNIPVGLGTKTFSFNRHGVGNDAPNTPATTPGPTACNQPSTAPETTQEAMFSDDFSTGDGSGWQVTSGSWTRQDGIGRSDSPAFGANTTRRDFTDVSVSVKIRNLGYRANSTKAGVHLWLRHIDQSKFYAISMNRRDNRILIRKKLPGGTKGSSYYELGSGFYQVPTGHPWQSFTATVKTVDGSARITLMLDGRTLLATEDKGIGGPPILEAGAVGLRSNNVTFEADDLLVERPQI